MIFGIIAAGEGSRLKKENAKASKPLIKVNGIPLIERLFTLAENNKVESISCIVNERSEEHTSELQSHSFISYAVFCLKKKTNPIYYYLSHHLNSSLLQSQH